jgi:hypothetical protein
MKIKSFGLPIQSKIKNRKSKMRHPQPSTLNSQLGARFLLLLPPFALLCGCQVLTYSSPQGERFTRSSLGTKTSIQSLSVDSDTNGVRRVKLEGCQNDSTQALGAVTEAAVRAALQGVKP